MGAEVVRDISCAFLIKGANPACVELYSGSPLSPDTITVVIRFKHEFGGNIEFRPQQFTNNVTAFLSV